MGKLHDILKEPKFSVFREKLFEHKFQYELKIYSALNNPDIEVFLPEIDKDGFDIILHDTIQLIRFQLKTILKTSKTCKWEIKKNLIRPNVENTANLGYENSPNGSGVEGGFILIVGDTKNDDLTFDCMYYTDAFILALFDSGILKHKNSKSQKVVETCSLDFKKVKTGVKKADRDLKIEVTKSSMIKTTDLNSLFILADLPGSKGLNWRPMLIEFLRTRSKEARNEVVELVKKMVNDNRFEIG